jgi:hypothetical protein
MEARHVTKVLLLGLSRHPRVKSIALNHHFDRLSGLFPNLPGTKARNVIFKALFEVLPGLPGQSNPTYRARHQFEWPVRAYIDRYLDQVETLVT